ncbi:MAG: NAD-dependent epimerase/dehydratase family protein, partial [Gammaproteobacteria bacterium]
MILVTGGAGFIGSHLVEELLRRGNRVRVLDSFVEQVHGAAPGGLRSDTEVIRADVRDRSSVDAALDGVEVVFHQAAEVGVGQSMYEIERYVGANTFGTATLLESLLARRGQIRKLIVASSMSIYGEGAYACGQCGPIAPVQRPLAQLEARDWEMRCPQCDATVEAVGTRETKALDPASVYAVTKQDQEQLCIIVGRAYGIPAVALRYFNVYGAGQALSNPYTGVAAIFSSRLLNGQRPMIFEDGLQSRDFTHVSDIVQANLLAMESESADFQAINIGTGVATSVKRIAELLAEGLGVAIEPETVGRFREGDIRHCYADISSARSV